MSKMVRQSKATAESQGRRRAREPMKDDWRAATISKVVTE